MDPVLAKEGTARARLLEAGINLFAEKGYAGTSVREIVSRAGVTKPVLYYYFKSKEGMFRFILDWAAERQEAMLKEVLETPGTVLDRLIYLYRRIYQGVLEKQNLFKMIHNLIFGPPRGAPEYDYQAYQVRLVKAIKAIYAEGLAAGEVKAADPEEVAVLVLGLIDFCFHLAQAQPESSDPELPDRLLRLAFRGLGRGEGD
ncbi:MAG: TetR/AcrR family transcriptional regulator [Pseudomonadota bacterium]